MKMESFQPQNLEPKKEVISEPEKERLNLAKHARRILLATGIAASALFPNKSEAQKAKEREPIVVHDKNDKRLKAYDDSLNSYTKNQEFNNLLKEKIKKGITNEEFDKLSYGFMNDINYNLGKKVPENKAHLLGSTTTGSKMYDDLIFKKPVQEIIYEPEEKVDKKYSVIEVESKKNMPEMKEGKEFLKYYDTKEEYEKALLEYNDSLNLYMNGEGAYKKIIATGKDNYGNSIDILNEKRFFSLKDVENDYAELLSKSGMSLGQAKNEAKKWFEDGLTNSPVSGKSVFPLFFSKFPGVNLLYVYRYNKPLAIPKLRENPPLGTFNIKGKEINYYSEEQKNDILGKLKKNNVIVNRVGDSQNYTVSRFYDGSIEEF